MTDIVLKEIRSGYNLSKINDNFEVIEDVINDEMLHTEGGNNVMSQELDMNSRHILNSPAPTEPTHLVRLQDLEDKENATFQRIAVDVVEGQTVINIEEPATRYALFINTGLMFETDGAYSVSPDGSTITMSEPFKEDDVVEIWANFSTPESPVQPTNPSNFFGNIQEVIEADLSVNDKVVTFGYNVIGDGGGAKYVVVSSTETIAPFGDHTLNNGLKLVLQTEDRHRAQCWGLFDDDTLLINQTQAFNAFRDDAFDKRYTMMFPEGQFVVDIMDLKNKTRIGLRGAGMEKTTFRPSGVVDLSTTSFLDCGFVGNDFTPVDSDIQFADIGDFSIRANGVDVLYGASFNNFRRGTVERIRCFDMRNSYRYGYSWLNVFQHLFSEQHIETGHTVDNASTNALTLTNFVSTSNVVGSKGYDFKNPQTVVLISPDCEGSGGTVGFDFNNGRAVTIINPHIEGAGNKFNLDNFNSNGLDVKIVGGACFNCPNALNFTGTFQSLNVDSFALHDVGASFSSLDIQVNAQYVTLNISAYLDDNTPATQEELKNALTIGAFCKSVVLNGEELLQTSSVRTKEFGARVDPVPTVPVNIPMDGGEVLPRRSYKVWATTRLSNSDTAAIEWFITINDLDQADIVEVVNIKNSIAQLVLDYNQFDNLFTIEAASTAGVDFSIIELD